MTTTRSRVTRRTEHSYAVLYAKPERIAVTIMPGDVLEFRPHGRRVKFRISIQTAMRYAVQLSAMAVGRKIKELTKAGVGRAEARKRAERELLK